MKRYHVTVNWTSTVDGQVIHDQLDGVWEAENMDEAIGLARAAAGNPWRSGAMASRVFP